MTYQIFEKGKSSPIAPAGDTLYEAAAAINDLRLDRPDLKDLEIREVAEDEKEEV